MASDVASILVYLHIPLTIARSITIPSHLQGLCNSQKHHRILIACIRNLGRCLCPRCLIPMDCVVKMGMRRDMMQRTTLARLDDNHRRRRVADARRFIYDQEKQINSAGVERLLAEHSLVPTEVRLFLLNDDFLFPTLFACFRTRFRTNCRHSVLTCSLCSSLISCTNLNLVFGKRSLSTSFAFWTAMMKTSNMN